MQPIMHNSAQSADVVVYPQTYGAQARQDQVDQQAADEAAGRGRSTGTTIKSPAEIIALGDSLNVLPQPDELAMLRACLTKRVHKFPEKQQNWETLKQYIATDWFILWGYFCQSDYRCWKKSLMSFPQWQPAMGKDIAKCVSKLVKNRPVSKK